MRPMDGEPDPRPDPTSWSSDDLRGLTDEERAQQLEDVVLRDVEESRRRIGELRPGDIRDRKGRMPTITELVSTPEERAARAEQERRR